MLKENQEIEIKWSNQLKQHYIDKGYIYTYIGDKFLVKANDLSKGSHKIVLVTCDYCGKIIKKAYATFLRQHDSNFGDCCSDCSAQKHSKIFMEKYGVNNPSKVKKIKDKRKETFIDRFGYDNPSKSEEIKQKKISTTMKNYGVSSPLKSKEIQNKSQRTCFERYGVNYTTQTKGMKEKSKQSCMERYGVDNASKSEEIKEKIIQTWLAKYGVKNIMELDEFREKIINSFVKNNNYPTSSMQIKISDMIKEIYGLKNVKDNVPCGLCLLDMVLKYKGYNIDIEYDGWYWHKNKQEKDKRRNYYLLNKGFKILRIRSNNEFPTKKQIINGIDYLVKDNHSLCYIDLDIKDEEIIYSYMKV